MANRQQLIGKQTEMHHSQKSSFVLFIEKRWYSSPGVLWLLLPLEWLFRVLASLRKAILMTKREELSLPLVIVGNIAVGGTGKTPVLIALAKYIQGLGHKPGVISRGYGRVSGETLMVGPQSDSKLVGDEPLEIFRSTGVPVCVAKKRIDAVRYLAENSECNVILADDGLQHYALKRDLEFVVLDEKQPFGNGHCFPLGPLREAPSRLKTVDIVLQKNSKAESIYSFVIEPTHFENVKTGEIKNLDFFNTQAHLYALAGIGRPEKFFSTLLSVLDHKNISFYSFADHYNFTPADFSFAGNNVLIMTAKDAVKCKAFAQDNWWSLHVRAVFPPVLENEINKKIAFLGQIQ
ncbi:lipid-A-disaccharide kinase [Alteromonadaceae bacterium Bs31]|nr:lipid-A-disaccharide kinase [Alteromonadaceae bacterium Bs31]